MNSVSILNAAVQAARWHADQRRKGRNREPYINHLLEVAALVAEADPENTDLIVAALLHDAIEDQPVMREQIADQFNERVASLVMEATDDKRLPKSERKRLQVETAPGKSRDGKQLKLADKISNLRSLAAAPPADWDLDRRKAYIEWSADVAAGLFGVSNWLDGQFEQARKRAQNSLENI